jgi:hypothetical protein
MGVDIAGTSVRERQDQTIFPLQEAVRITADSCNDRNQQKDPMKANLGQFKQHLLALARGTHVINRVECR